MNRLFAVLAAIALSNAPVWASAISEAAAAAETSETIGLGDVGAGSLLLRTPEPGKYVPAPTVATDVDMQITGMIGRVRVTQRFVNPGQDWVEGVYAFPLPETAAVDRMRMRIGERVIDGQIKERAQAKKIYENAKKSGKRAALVEQERPNIFTNSVANIGPGDSVTVEIEYQESLRYQSGQFSVRFPMVVAPRFIPGDPVITEESVPRFEGTGWAPNTDQVPDASRITPPVIHPDEGAINPVRMTVALHPGVPLASLESPSHDIHTDEQGDGTFTVRFAGERVPADRDFVLTWTPAAGEAPRAALFTEQLGGETYALMMVYPPDAPKGYQILRREIVFVIDTSGSMGGASIRQAKRALTLAVERLRDGDRFNIIEFNSTTRALFHRPRPASILSKQRALEYVGGLDAGGGTVMLPALSAALARAGESSFVRQVVFLTDGAVGNEAALFREIHQNLGDTRLFTVGIGSAPNSHFMRKAAQFGRGSFTYIGSVTEVGEKMARLFERLESPVMQGLSIDWPAENAPAEMFPARLPDLYAGEPLVFSARLPKAEGVVQISGTRARETWRTRLTLAGGSPQAGVGVLWARRKIAGLMDTLTEGASEAAVRDAVIDVALRHHLVSKYTSLVAVDITPVRPQASDLTKRAVPANLPAGWEYEKVFGVPPRTATPARLQLLTGALMLCIGLVALAVAGRPLVRCA